jgi:hypothetical protein
MASQESVNNRVRRIVDSAVRDGTDAADEAVLRSIIRSISESEVISLLDEFFDVQLVVRNVHGVLMEGGRTWDGPTLNRLGEALLFCGLATEGVVVQSTTTKRLSNGGL